MTKKNFFFAVLIVCMACVVPSYASDNTGGSRSQRFSLTRAGEGHPQHHKHPKHHHKHHHKDKTHDEKDSGHEEHHHHKPRELESGAPVIAPTPNTEDSHAAYNA